MKSLRVSPANLSRLLQLAIAVPTSLVLPSAAQAAGLTGAFAPANWVLSNTNADQTFSSPQNTCIGLSYEVACVTINDALTGSFDLIGSADGFPGGDNANGATTTERSTTWELVNTGLPAQVSFKWLFSSGEDNADIASYLIGSSEYILSDVPTSIAAQIANLTIASNASIAFRVRTTDNSGNPGILSITDFGAVTMSGPIPVPAPLSLFGCAAAFRWSRKLRRRLDQTSRFKQLVDPASR
jgi:hypothetical protein